MKSVRHLYDYFLPSQYTLTIAVEREARAFHGTVVISGHKVSADEPIRLHAKDLTIHTALVGDTVVPVEACEDDEVSVGTYFEPGDYTLTLTFSGRVTDGMHGMYPCYYKHEGTKKELIATQFESHHAREVFPCVDEPEAKATFDLTLVTEPDVLALSNMPLVEPKAEISNATKWHFQTTPRMSTYLLAWVIGDLHGASTASRRGIKIGVYATQAQPTSNFDHALEVARTTIDFYEDYYDVPYPLSASNHVALPDFTVGAMENWGLVTYREVCLLTDPAASKSTREYVATVIAHELAHQWFGNLVTMKWWDDLWLNESFANVMEYIALDATHPEWHVWQLFANAETPLALARDRFAPIQPVKYDIHHPDEINAAFDKAIVYAKGSRLIRMAREYVGDEAFRAGLTQYFTAHAYSNTVSDDLWRALSEASGRDVGAFIASWLTSPGYPVVSVTTTPTGYRLTQERFLSQRAGSDAMWTIPLSSHHVNFPSVLDTRSVDIDCTHNTTPLLNADNVNHFITYYDDPAFDSIVSAFQSGELTPIERAMVLYEQLLLAQSDYSSSDRIMRLLQLCSDEQSDLVWSIIGIVVEELTYAKTDLWPTIRDICAPTYSRLGTTQNPDDSDNDKRVRAIVLDLMSRASDRAAIDAGLAIVRDAPSLDLLPHALRTCLLSITARYGTAADHTRLVKTHRTTTDPTLRDEIAKALSCTQDTALLARLFAELADVTVFKPQDTPRMYGYLLKNPVARDGAWRWMQDNWSWIEATYAGDFSLDRFIQYAGQSLAGDGYAEQFEAFFAPRSAAGYERVIAIGIDEIRMRTAWAKRETSDAHATME